tara:strand:- start:2061 stop:2501 length:441 start_codon:yes stop_codon:yes gene_type:complete
MPERVTKEERKISLAIEKARDTKEILSASLENNRNPIDDESEHVKLKRPKAENDKTKFESNDGPASNHAYAGEETSFKKAYGEPSDKELFNALGEITKLIDKAVVRLIDLSGKFADKSKPQVAHEEALVHLEKAEKIIEEITNTLM